MDIVDSLALGKERLRQDMRRKRRGVFRGLGSDGVRSAAKALATHGLGPGGALARVPVGIVAGYWPRQYEIDPRLLMAKMAEAGHELALPVVVGDHQPLEFRQWEPGLDLEVGHHDIPVPCESCPAVLPDIALIPLIAFDRRLRRLGQGGGYFDRTFAVHRPSLIVGVAFSAQEVAEVPAGPHDVVMDLVITEQGVVCPERA